jgi:hypothetical protein
MPILLCGFTIHCTWRKNFVIALLVNIGRLVVLNYNTVEPFYPSNTHDTGKNDPNGIPVIARKRGIIHL